MKPNFHFVSLSTRSWMTLLAASIGLLAAQPFFSGSIGQRGDALLHLYRVAQLDILIKQGILYSRWWPDIGMGFGLPLFNYYAPLFYYLAEIPRLISASQVTSIAIALIFISIGGSVGMFLWISEIACDFAGIVSAIAYAFSPYLLSNVFGRGAYAESLALAILPWLMWSGYRLAYQRNGSVGVAGIIIAILFLTHNISALMDFPFFIAYVLYCLLTNGYIRQPYTLLRFGLAIMMGIGLGAFFLIPAFFERNLVFIERTLMPDWANFRNNFIDLRSVIDFATSADPKLISGGFKIGLSPLMIFCFAGPLSLFLRHRIALKSQVLFGIIGVMTSLWMATSASRDVWEQIPILQFIQFPWRFLGLASLFIAAISGIGLANFALIAVSVQARMIFCALWLIINNSLGFHLQYLPSPTPSDISFSPQDIALFERRTSFFGTTSGQEYTPRDVIDTPSYSLSRWAFGGEWWDTGELPSGTQFLGVSDSSLFHEIKLNLPAQANITLRIFNFAGWRATLNGIEIPIVAAQPHGLVNFLLPAGKNELVVQFGGTPFRDFSSAITVLTALVSVGGFIITSSSSKKRFLQLRESLRSNNPHKSKEFGLTAICVLMLLGVKTFYVDRSGGYFLDSRFNGVTVKNARWTANVIYDDRIELLGVEGDFRVKAGRQINITGLWRVLRSLDIELSSSAQIINAKGMTVAQSDNFSIGNLSTIFWQPDEYAQDLHQITIPANLQPGQYSVRWIVYLRNNPAIQLSPRTRDAFTTPLEILP